MIALQAPADPCQGCPRRHAGGCTTADFMLMCPRGVKIEMCDKCLRRMPGHLLHDGTCQECREGMKPVDSFDRCPPRCH